MADSLFTELRRRNVFKVGVAYLVLAWVVVQVTDTAVPALHLPEWIITAVLFFGVIGFPFAIFFAWAFEITPDGVKRESEITPEESITAHTGRKLDFVIIGLMAIALGYFIYESRFSTEKEQNVSTDSINSELNSAEVIASQKIIQEPEGSSIAVLPFVNMSSDPEQEYFSDGISEEILNVLAKIPKLHVTSRSSAFFYKGKDIKISKVAQELGVKNVLEGSVRKFGTRIRITAQLIEAGSDKHLWSDTYDRELIDLFAIQDEISAAIVKALKAKLGLEAKVESRDMASISLEAHNEYLKGRFFVENRNKTDLEKALAHFDEAIRLEPDYASAWMGKAWATYFLSETGYGDIPIEVSIARAKPAAEKALLLDPNLAEAHGVMGLIEDEFNNQEKSIAYFEAAIKLNPNYADAHSWYANAQGDFPEKYVELRKRAVQLSPMSLLANLHYAATLLFYGNIDEASEIAEQMLAINDSHQFPFLVLSMIRTLEGKYAEATIFREKAAKHSNGAKRNIDQAAELLATLGLGDKAAAYYEGTSFEMNKHWFTGNDELFISQTRENFPRNETDALGMMVRALAESFAGNHAEAVKYFELTKLCDECNERLFSYQMAGDTVAAQRLLNKLKLQLTSWLNTGVKNWEFYENIAPIEIKIMEIATLENDIEKAIDNLKKAMDKSYIISYRYKMSLMYKKLREHPDWQAILDESNKRAAAQRQIYLKLAAEEDNKNPLI